MMKDLYKNRDPDQMKATGDYLKSQMAEAGLPCRVLNAKHDAVRSVFGLFACTREKTFGASRLASLPQ